MQIGWPNLNWQILESLRANYLNPTPTGVADYWKDTNHLRHYDFTFAQRIGWKWRAVLTELFARYPALQLASVPRVLDFACGTGIAAREWLRMQPQATVEIGLIDRSTLATQFARQQITTEYPNAKSMIWDAKFQTKSWDVCLVSHVTNEMGKRGTSSLVDLVQRSKLAILVEPGTPAAAESLRFVREAVLATHIPLAPCTHAAMCGMAATERANDWCHNFAKPPREIFHDAGWTEFGKRMGIDLRSLPVSYVVLADQAWAEAMQLNNVDQARVMGRARIYKGYAKALVCNSDGIAEKMLQKRDDPQLYKELDKDHPFAVLLNR